MVVDQGGALSAGTLILEDNSQLTARDAGSKVQATTMTVFGAAEVDAGAAMSTVPTSDFATDTWEKA